MPRFSLRTLSMGLLLAIGSSAQAATLTVNTTSDSISLASAGDGKCSLREAVSAINDGNPTADCPGTGFGIDDTIVFDLASANTITLEDGGDADIEIEKALAIHGPEPGGLIIRRDFVTTFDFRLLEVTANVPLHLENITLTGGETLAEGGALLTWGDVTLVNSSVSGNEAQSDGGGIWAGGNVTLDNSTVIGNSTGELAGGVIAFGSLSANQSAVFGNASANDVGGAYAERNLSLTNSTVSGNRAGDDVGGAMARGDVSLVNSTVSDNSAGDDVGGLYGGGTVTLSSSTVAGNSAVDNVGGLYAMADVTLTHTILSGNTARTYPDLLAVGMLSADYSLLGSGITVSGEGNISTDDPQLESLADNGGPTPTRLPMLGSPAIDSGNNSYTTNQVGSVDQRGISRPQDGDGNNAAIWDIGSVEHETVEPIPTLGTLGLVLLSGLMGLLGWRLSHRNGNRRDS